MSENSASRRPLPRRLRLVGVVALLITIGLAATGIIARREHEQVLKEKVDADATPSVNLVQPGSDNAHRELVLPGSIQAYYDAPIFARVSGYLKKWYVDIGAKVKTGETLADIETPELDQQLLQAQADLATAVAKEKLAEITTKRWQSMLASTSVSKQEADEKNGDYEAKKAEVVAQHANVDRLEALSGFKRIVAPFDGVVTARKTDIGALINAGSGNGQELFHVADTHELRVYVQVPQTYADQIHAGMQAQLRLPEQPGRDYAIKVVGTANAINESSRTLLVQLEADNNDGKLISGSYADVHFDLPATPGVLQLPVTALLFRQHGMQVATVDSDNKVALKSIQIGRDFGTKVEVVDGISANDRIIDSPPDWIAQGDKVRALVASPPAKSVEKSTATEKNVVAADGGGE